MTNTKITPKQQETLDFINQACDTVPAPQGWKGDYYYHPRNINGELCAVARFLFTWGVILNIDRKGHDGRLCFKDEPSAFDFIDTWDGNLDSIPAIGEKGLQANKLLERHSEIGLLPY